MSAGSHRLNDVNPIRNIKERTLTSVANAKSRG